MTLPYEGFAQDSWSGLSFSRVGLIMAEKKKEPKQPKYEIIRRKNMGSYRVTTFMAPGLPQWPVFIKKNEWSLEE